MRTVRHHLLEIILWPNTDGTFKYILNTEKRLKELGVYNDYKLTIKLTNSAHSKLHRHVEKLNNQLKVPDNTGRIHTDETKQKISRTLLNRHYTHNTETREKLSNASKGRFVDKRWFNNGITNIRATECPPGFKPGRIYKRKESSN